jgi:glutamate-1-semialdehyde 2,1-aminomutase
MNCILPVNDFLKNLRELCDQYGVVLIFDEVMTGFRVALGGAQEIYGVKPDLTTLGKIIGGGLPVGAFGGKKEIMEYIAPLGPVYQAGTLSGNPLSMSAGLAMLNALSAKPDFYKELGMKTEKLLSGIKERAEEHNIGLTTNSAGGMFGIFFTNIEKVTNFKESSECKIEDFKRFFHLMLEDGIYMAPSAYEAGFISIKHSDGDIEKTIASADKAFKQLQS